MPKAKVRVERMWGTLQERILIEMRLAGSKTTEIPSGMRLLDMAPLRYAGLANSRYSGSTGRSQVKLPVGRLYFWSVVVAGTIAAMALLAGGAGRTDLVPKFWSDTFLVFAVLGFVTETITVPLPRGGRLTAGFSILFACLLELGIEPTVAILGLTTLLGGSLINRRPLPLGLFNLAQYTLSYLAAYGVLAAGHFTLGQAVRSQYGLIFLAVLAYLAVNVVLVDGYIAVEKRVPLLRMLWEDDRWEVMFTFVQAPLAVLLVVLYHDFGWVGASLALIPLVVTTVLLAMHMRVRQVRAEIAQRNRELRKAVADLDAANRELELIQKVARTIASRIDLGETLELLVTEIRTIVSCDDLVIFLAAPDSGDLIRQKPGNTPDAQLEPYMPAVRQAVSAREAVMASQPEPLEYRSLLAVPIVDDEGAQGAIVLLARIPDSFSERDRRLLATLASHATFAIKNARLYQATQQLAITDGLTGVYNRRYFQRQLESELRRAPRYGYPTSLILLDVDHFKQFNDANGHLLGDQVLRSMAQILRDSVRETDVVARYGGEEFAVILPETPPDVALTVAERIRSRMAQHTFWGKGQKPVRLTASLGIATHSTSEITADELIERADRALYKAKHAGRDRVCSWAETDAEPLDRTAGRQAPQTTARRLPARLKVAIDVTAWQKYLLEGTEPLIMAMEARLAEHRFEPSPADRARWRQIVAMALQILGDQLARPQDEFAGLAAERLSRHELYSPIRAEITRWISHGLTLTQSENLVLAISGALQEHVRLAPFSPQEQLVILAAVDRFTHYLQLAVSWVWHEFYQQTNQHLVILQQLEERFRSVSDLDELLAEAIRMATDAMEGDAGILLLVDEARQHLRIRSSWGIPTEDAQVLEMPIDQGLAGEAFRTQKPVSTADALVDPQVHRPFLETIYQRTGARGGIGVPLVYQGESIGVLVVFSSMPRHLTSNEIKLGQAVAGLVAAAIERARLEEVRQERYLEALSTLIESLEAKDRYLRGHHQNLAALALELGRRLGLDEAQLVALGHAGRFHDVGKVAVPDDVLLKPDALTVQEREAIEIHPEMGARLLSPLAGVAEAIPAIRHHHERWDGTGYPDGLKGEEIPILARIVAVAEAWESMTTPKAYRPAIPPERAFEEMWQSGHFDPHLLALLGDIVHVNRSSPRAGEEGTTGEAFSDRAAGMDGSAGADRAAGSQVTGTAVSDRAASAAAGVDG